MSRRLALIAAPFVVGVVLGWWVPSAATGLPAADVTASPLTMTVVEQRTPAATAEPSVTPTPLASETPTPSVTPSATSSATPSPTATSTPTSTATPVPRGSVLDEGTMLTIYGRGFGIAPILGLLGRYKGFDDMDRDVRRRFYGPIQANNGGRPVVPAVHLIYGLAIPCSPGDDCLLYLEGAGIDVIKEYIEPAQKNGWQVILDSQIGRSDPVAQVKRMIDKGYMKYEHVHVALDPEFHVYPGRTMPGIPVGTLKAAQINEAQALLDDYAQRQGLKRRKMLMVHQFGDAEVDDGVPYMVENKKTLKTFPMVDLVLDADGVGGPDSKVAKYNKMMNPEPYPFIKYRAIKLFTENPEAHARHSDTPFLEWAAVFGRKDTPGGHRLRWPPDVISIA